VTHSPSPCAIAGPLTAADLREADLSISRLDAAVLDHSRMVGVDLNGASAEHARMAGVDLRLADLRDARLHRSDLRGANAAGSRQEGLSLDGSTLHGATGLGTAPRKRAKSLILIAVASFSLLVLVALAGSVLLRSGVGDFAGGPLPPPLEVGDLLEASVSLENTDDLTVELSTRVAIRVALIPDTEDDSRAAPAPVPTTTLVSDGTPADETVPATGRASVSLLAASTGTFEITPLQGEEPTQFIRSEPAIWLFDVKPLVAGPQELIIRFTPYTCPQPCADSRAAQPVARRC
jgi:uncharacterized protein YjbI with pentapeptide repeats